MTRLGKRCRLERKMRGHTCDRITHLLSERLVVFFLKKRPTEVSIFRKFLAFIQSWKSLFDVQSQLFFRRKKFKPDSASVGAKLSSKSDFAVLSTVQTSVAKTRLYCTPQRNYDEKGTLQCCPNETWCQAAKFWLKVDFAAREQRIKVTLQCKACQTLLPQMPRPPPGLSGGLRASGWKNGGGSAAFLSPPFLQVSTASWVIIMHERKKER